MPSETFYCDVCGAPYFIDGANVSHHEGEGSDGIDYEADADHTPYGMEAK